MKKILMFVVLTLFAIFLCSCQAPETNTEKPIPKSDTEIRSIQDAAVELGIELPEENSGIVIQMATVQGTGLSYYFKMFEYHSKLGSCIISSNSNDSMEMKCKFN